MDNNTILNQLQEIFRAFFNDPKLVLSETTSANDIEDWDSMNHMNLMSEVEKSFKIQFEFFELMDFENVADLIKALDK